MKPEFYIDFPAGQQHTLRYFRLQGSTPAQVSIHLCPAVSSMIQRSPIVGEPER